MSNVPSAGGAHTFTLTDADGLQHVYEVTLHPTDTGTEILWALVANGAEPFARLADSALKAPGALESIAAAFGGDEDTKQSALSLLAGADFKGIGTDAKASVQALDMPRLQHKLLHHVTRDGLPLRVPANFDRAYRGNYWEMVFALWEVVRYNRFLPALPI
jgi:hypothetical protein